MSADDRLLAEIRDELVTIQRMAKIALEKLAQFEGKHPWQPGSPAGINIGIVDWRTKQNEAASEADSWAWAFSKTAEGRIRDETRQLVEEIERYGKVEVDGYVITLGGRDKDLLNRTKLGSRRR